MLSGFKPSSIQVTLPVDAFIPCQLNPQPNGTMTITFANPITVTTPHIVLPGYQGPDAVLSVQPDGTDQGRPPKDEHGNPTAGPYEKFTPNGANLLGIQPDSNSSAVFTRMIVSVLA
jgi:hypothetical protein